MEKDIARRRTLAEPLISGIAAKYPSKIIVPQPNNHSRDEGGGELLSGDKKIKYDSMWILTDLTMQDALKYVHLSVLLPAH